MKNGGGGKSMRSAFAIMDFVGRDMIVLGVLRHFERIFHNGVYVLQALSECCKSGVEVIFVVREHGIDFRRDAPGFKVAILPANSREFQFAGVFEVRKHGHFIR